MDSKTAIRKMTAAILSVGMLAWVLATIISGAVLPSMIWIPLASLAAGMVFRSILLGETIRWLEEHFPEWVKSGPDNSGIRRLVAGRLSLAREQSLFHYIDLDPNAVEIRRSYKAVQIACILWEIVPTCMLLLFVLLYR